MSTMDAEGLVAELASVRQKYKTTEVEKEVPPVFDLGNLTVFDVSPFSFAAGEDKEAKESRLQALHRDNAQLLVNEIFALPTRREGQVVVVELPPVSTALPREKPLPKDRPLTRWEQFAKSKGIQKKKRSRMIWDEAKQEWMPRFGYKRANDDQNDWAIEVPANADPYEDQFEKRAEEKKKRIAKNKASQARNAETAERLQRKGLKGVAVAPMPVEMAPKLAQGSAKQLATAARHARQAEETAVAREQRANLKKELEVKLAVTRTSTASLGRFDKALDTDKPIKKRQQKESAAGNSALERKKALEFVEKIAKPATDVNVRKAVNFSQQEGERKNKRQKK